ncbi:hypothetical protein BFF78_00660 [Streptomyces fodineus]|uniref:Uncharacterized protein n=1 Tax=Streptomyces fodineus TaxID=1904616 RepID=A0A1D7Y2I5_9ACTN|nr:hypothetical protein BFF78_00660 [Streptomyces fodineus]
MGFLVLCTYRLSVKNLATRKKPKFCLSSVCSAAYMGTKTALPPSQCPAVRIRLCPGLSTTLAVQWCACIRWVVGPCRK